MNKTFHASLVFSFLALAACDNKPTEGKPAAAVGEAQPTTTAAATAPAASAAAAPAKTEQLAVSPATSKIEFVGAKVTGKHDGKFEKFSGTVDFTADKIENTKIKVDIDLSSVKTDQEQLDGHLKAPDFFDVAKFATATFESTEVKAQPGADGATHLITGNLDFHGVKKSLQFPAKVSVSDDKVTAKAEFGINRKDWKVEYAGKKDDLIKDDVLIKLDLELARAK